VCNPDRRHDRLRHAGTDMSTPIDARTFADLLADPGAAEAVSAATGCPLVVFDASDG
jgi:hypothetical protein